MSQTQKVGSHKTKVVSSEGLTTVRYHDTIVTRFNSLYVWLDSGGWQTTTTKTRMNQASNEYGLDYSVYQKNYEWFVEYRGETLEFTDGMRLDR